MKFDGLCGIVLLSLGAIGPAAALDCSQQVAEASTDVNGAAERMKTMPDGQRKKDVHMLIDDAKMYLHGAKHNQEKPQGDLDTARCMAKAGAASGYAQAARTLAGARSQ